MRVSVGTCWKQMHIKNQISFLSATLVHVSWITPKWLWIASHQTLETFVCYVGAFMPNEQQYMTAYPIPWKFLTAKDLSLSLHVLAHYNFGKLLERISRLMHDSNTSSVFWKQLNVILCLLFDWENLTEKSSK